MRTALFMATLVSFGALASEVNSYEEASQLAKSDSLNPEYREWYLREMRPAFSQYFRSSVAGCLKGTQSNETLTFGLVFAVDRSGKVRRVFWKASTALTACLEAGLREATFPPSPKDEFYFGMEVKPRSPAV